MEQTLPDTAIFHDHVANVVVTSLHRYECCHNCETIARIYEGTQRRSVSILITRSEEFQHEDRKEILVLQTNMKVTVPEGASELHVRKVFTCSVCHNKMWPERREFNIVGSSADNLSWLTLDATPLRHETILIEKINVTKVTSARNGLYIDGTSALELKLTLLSDSYLIGLKDDLKAFLGNMVATSGGFTGLPAIARETIMKNRNMTKHQFCVELSSKYRYLKNENIDLNLMPAFYKSQGLVPCTNPPEGFNEICARFPNFNAGIIAMSKTKRTMEEHSVLVYPEPKDFLRALQSLDPSRQKIEPEYYKLKYQIPDKAYATFRASFVEDAEFRKKVLYCEGTESITLQNIELFFENAFDMKAVIRKVNGFSFNFPSMNRSYFMEDKLTVRQEIVNALMDDITLTEKIKNNEAFTVEETKQIAVFKKAVSTTTGPHQNSSERTDPKKGSSRSSSGSAETKKITEPEQKREEKPDVAQPKTGRSKAEYLRLIGEAKRAGTQVSKDIRIAFAKEYPLSNTKFASAPAKITSKRERNDRRKEERSVRHKPGHT
jgi:hypothetical protein